MTEWSYFTGDRLKPCPFNLLSKADNSFTFSGLSKYRLFFSKGSLPKSYNCPLGPPSYPSDQPILTAIA